MSLTLMLLQVALLTPMARAFTTPAVVPSRRHHIRPILKAASSFSSSFPTVPPVRSHPYDNLQQQASLWGGNSHFGRYILRFIQAAAFVLFVCRPLIHFLLLLHCLHMQPALPSPPFSPYLSLPPLLSTPGYTAVLIVPTGIGASIGGYAGDALPVAHGIASVVDTLITHPNVMNGTRGGREEGREVMGEERVKDGEGGMEEEEKKGKKKIKGRRCMVENKSVFILVFLFLSPWFPDSLRSYSQTLQILAFTPSPSILPPSFLPSQPPPFPSSQAPPSTPRAPTFSTRRASRSTSSAQASGAFVPFFLTKAATRSAWSWTREWRRICG